MMRTDDVVFTVFGAVVLTTVVVGLFAAMLSAVGRADRAERELRELRGVEKKTR